MTPGIASCSKILAHKFKPADNHLSQPLIMFKERLKTDMIRINAKGIKGIDRL